MLFFKNFLFFLVLISAIALIDSFYIGNAFSGIDDGNIFLNYAHHISNGEGFVFNTGGERVEGFTSFLWVLVCAWFYAFSAHPEHLLIAFSLLLTTLTVTFVFTQLKYDVQRLNKQFADKYLFWIYTAFIVSIGPSYIAWSVLSLMENALWNFVFTALILLILQTYQSEKTSALKKILIILLGCILIITRPEALAWNIFFSVVLIWIAWQGKRKIYFPVLFITCFVSTGVALFKFRLNYFGYPLPNTYYAKISPDKIYNFAEGFKYALDFIAGYQPIITFCLLLMSIVAIFNFKDLFRRNETIANNANIVFHKLYIVTCLVAIGLVLPCTTGGDHFGGFRFYQELLLLFSWSVISVLWFTKNNKQLLLIQKKLALVTAILFLFILGLNNIIDLREPAKTQLNIEFQLAVEGRDLANKLNDLWLDKKPSVGVIAVGGFGLDYLGTTVDLMGLNNTLMGHSPGDRKGIKNHAAFNKDVFYKLNPDIIEPEIISNYKSAVIQYGDLLSEENFDNQAMKNIFNDDVFKQKYFPVIISRQKTKLFAFVRNDFFTSMLNNKSFEVQRVYL